MIFWIVLGIIAVGTLLLAAYWADVLDSVGMGIFASLVVGAAAMGVVTFILVVCDAPNLATYRVHDTETYRLTALANSSGEQGQIEGNLFAVYGIIGKTEYVQFVTNEHGDYELRQAKASEAHIYQNVEPANATAHVIHSDLYTWWLLPWDFGNPSVWTFHIPKGSIASSYSINVNK